MRRTRKTGICHSRWSLRLHLGGGILALTLAGCDTDGLVDLTDPDIITAGVATDTANINELRSGALFEFARAVSGTAANNDTPGIVGITGLMTDEMWFASTFIGPQEIDRRNIENTNNDVFLTYQRIHRARNFADRASEQYTAAGRSNTAAQAMLSNLAGFSLIFLAENFCSGVPVSRTSLGGELTFGAPQTTEQLVDSALVRFDAALAQATAANSAPQQNVARVGRARALLIRGDFAGAAAAVANVPADFVYNVDYSENASGQNNGVWYNVNSERRASVASQEGVNGIRFFNRGATNNTIDPRAPADSTGTGLGASIQHYRQTKYATRGADIPLATGIEAQLIRAEAALNKGQSAAYLPILNQLRQGVTGLAPLTDPGNPQARVRQFFQERAFWLWLTAHRLGDLRRMVKHYGFDQNQVFPTGQTIFGSPYGSDVNFPIPFQEVNNPTAAQAPSKAACIDRNA